MSWKEKVRYGDFFAFSIFTSNVQHPWGSVLTPYTDGVIDNQEEGKEVTPKQRQTFCDKVMNQASIINEERP